MAFPLDDRRVHLDGAAFSEEVAPTMTTATCLVSRCSPNHVRCLAEGQCAICVRNVRIYSTTPAKTGSLSDEGLHKGEVRAP
jgi:hypothetical protein